MSRKPELDARRVLELLQDPAGTPKSVAEKVDASPEAVDEARCLLEEIATAESDAILAMPPVLARALLRAAALAGRHEVLVEAASANDKELQREAKRLAHALKHRGVEVALPTKAREPAPAPAPTVSSEPPVYMSSLDAAGERAVFWTRTLPGRGVELAQLLLGDGGVMELVSGEMSRKRFRELSDDLPRRGVVTIVEAPREKVRVVIDRARVAGRDRGKLPGNFPAWASTVLGPTPEMPPPPLRPEAEGDPAPGDVAALARRSAELFAEPELSRWVPEDRDALEACALAVEEASRSLLYLEGPMGDSQRADAVAAAIERSSEGYFDDRRRGAYAARLLDTAWLLERTGRPESARIAASAARSIAAGAPAASVPFLREIFARVFARSAPASAAEPAASLIVDPAAAGEERPSGLIVPE